MQDFLLQSNPLFFALRPLSLSVERWSFEDNVFVHPHTPSLSPAAPQHSAWDSTARQALQDAQLPSLFLCSPLKSPIPKKPNLPPPHSMCSSECVKASTFPISHTPQPQNATPKFPHTLKSTKGINLLLGRAPLAWVQLFSVSQDWAQSLQDVYRQWCGMWLPPLLILTYQSP